MKKIAAILMILGIFSLAACKKGDTADKGGDTGGTTTKAAKINPDNVEKEVDALIKELDSISDDID